MAITVTVTPADKRIFVRIDETGPDDVVTAAVVADTPPDAGEGFWWTKLNPLQLSGIWRQGHKKATLTINDDVQVVEITY